MSRFSAASFASAAALAGCQPTAPSAMSQAERSAVEDSIRHLAATFIEADSQRDADRVMSLFTDSSDVTIVSDGLLRPSRESFAEALTALYDSVRNLEIIEDEARITVLGPDAAVLTAVYRYSRADTTGRTSEGQAALTYVCARRDGKWQIIHYHFSTAPGAA